jgi:hypothetical protein
VCDTCAFFHLGNTDLFLAGVEEVAETVQELWISYNLLSSLKGVEKLTKLRVREMWPVQQPREVSVFPPRVV